MLEVFAAYLTGICDLGRFVGTFVYHQIVGFGETPLAILANELTLRTHLATKVRPAVIIFDSHYSEHGAGSGLTLLSREITHKHTHSNMYDYSHTHTNVK